LDDYACLIFDDSMLDNNHPHKIELVRRHCSSDFYGLIINPAINQDTTMNRHHLDLQ
jgi:hypothetical protein